MTLVKIFNKFSVYIHRTDFHYLENIFPIVSTLYLFVMCKLPSEKSDGSLKSISRDVIWENIDNIEISDIINGLNMPKYLRKYLIYVEEKTYVPRPEIRLGIVVPAADG